MLGYPIFLKLERTPCLVFGGGEVAVRKIKGLLKRGARVTCVSRDFSAPLKQLARRHRAHISLQRSGKGRIRFGRAKLVVVATSDRKFNARIARLCRQKGIWVNVADDPELCDFYAPAIVERGPLQIAISTGGASPWFARRLREELEKVVTPSTGRLLAQLGKVRRQLLEARKKKP